MKATEEKSEKVTHQVKLTPATITPWIAQWAKFNITAQEINALLGKSSLDIPVLGYNIIISFKSQQQKTEGIIAALVKLYDPKNTNVLKLHVFSACMSTLLPALIVQHYVKLSQTVIKIGNVRHSLPWNSI